MNCTLAVAQIDPVLGDLPGNARAHADAARRAVRRGADVVVFPELSLTGYSVRDMASELAVDPVSDPALRNLRSLSRKITIVVGAIVSGDDHGTYNAGICFEDGNVIHVHRKVYPPTYGMFEEGRYFSSGRRVDAFDTRHGRFAMLICEDMWHPSLPYLATLDGAEVILTLTASPTRVGASTDGLDNKAVNHEHHRAYARLFSVYSVFANRTGFEDGVNFWGGSAIFAPTGDSMCEAALFEEDLILARLTSTQISRSRRHSRHVLDERPEILLANLQRLQNKVR